MEMITKEFLATIGIELDGSTYQAFAQHFEDTLFDRIIESVVDSLDDAQIQQLALMKNGDPEQLWKWLQVTVPELGEIIQDEIDILLGELAENSEHI